MNSLLVAKKMAYNEAANEVSFNRKRLNEQAIKKKRKISVKLYLIGLVFLVTVMAIATVDQFGRVIALNYQISQVEHTLHSAREEQQKLRLRAAQYSSLERIERVAIEDLGYQYPQEGQTKILTARQD